jgi:NAD(P)-dependent dehydrogenase (short-subunit alcohol dehydrogenase family)
MNETQTQSTAQFASYPSLRGRAVLVTGGATGIGEALVSHFARQGSRVAFLDVQNEAAHALVQRLEADGCIPPQYLHCDLTDLQAMHEAVAEVLGAFGAVDVLVNNAANDQRHLWENVTEAFWENSMAVNLRPQFFAIQAVAPAMRGTGQGSIINMSSIAWIVPSTGVPVYAAAKAAIVGLTRTMARELGTANIRVNAVLPGAISTDRQRKLWYTPEYKAKILESQSLKLEIVPDDVARLVLFLAADDSRAITGQSYVIDAGWV